MPKTKLLNSLLLTITTVLVLTTKVQANCADSVASLELVQPAMERYWQQLQQQTQFPWGKIQPYGNLSGDHIALTPEFARLSGTQKQQVLDLLRLDYNSNWFSLLNSQEQAAALKNPKIGAMSPYLVFASDGRIVSYPYSGCDRLTLLTEFNRYQMHWYGRELPPRQIRFPISPEQEKVVQIKFWQAVGYNQKDLQWLAWVPEQGYFEINIYNEARDRYQRRLRKFWQVAPKQYRYVILDENGTLLQDLTGMH
jgi:hypothetical protein